MPRKKLFEDFLEEVQTANVAYSTRGCAVGRLIDSLDEYDAVQVRTALARTELTSTAIERVLKSRVENGPSSYTIGRHRRGSCGCKENS